tara:strand:- start:8012 stop:8977 length:966 start_codon:yes stop_codon:yes gene_type:complete
MKALNALVIGLGGIGFGYDQNHMEDRDIVTTHVKAFYDHPDYNLIGVVDSDETKCQMVAQNCGSVSSSNLSYFSKDNIDIVSIATPTDSHFEVFKKTLLLKPKVILCEKPFSGNLLQAQRMIDLSKKEGTNIVVNYIRRFEPGTIEFLDSIRNGEIGDIEKGVIWYSKGLVNNGSHYIDLLNSLWGEPDRIRVLDYVRELSKQDFEVDLALHYGEKTIYMMAAQEENFSYHKMELVGTQGCAFYNQGGREIYIQRVSNDPLFSGYRILGSRSEITSYFLKYQSKVLDNIIAFIAGTEKLRSTGESALGALKVLNHIKIELL